MEIERAAIYHRMIVQGLCYGRVEQRIDPEIRGRMRCRIMGLHSEEIAVENLPWALPKSNAAWKDGGFFNVPPIGSYVWIEFIHGDHSYPVWSGGFWSIQKEKQEANDGTTVLPPTIPVGWFGGEEGKGILQLGPTFDDPDPLRHQPNNFGFVSPMLKRFEMDDRKARERVVVGDQVENHLFINSEHGVATLESGRGLRTTSQPTESVPNPVDVYKKHGITLSSNDEDNIHGAQIYTHKNWRTTIDDTLGYYDMSSPSGTKIRIDTADGKESIRMFTPSGYSVIVDQTGEIIQIATPAGEKFFLKNGEGFQIQSAGGSYVKGTDDVVELFSAKDVKIKATGDLNISAGGKLTIDGKAGVAFNEDADSVPATGPNYNVDSDPLENELDTAMPDSPELMKRAWDYDYYTKKTSTEGT